MIAETEGFTIRDVLKWMGDLDKERVIAKHAARQGLVSTVSVILRERRKPFLSQRHFGHFFYSV